MSTDDASGFKFHGSKSVIDGVSASRGRGRAAHPEFVTGDAELFEKKICACCDEDVIRAR